ncbi:hypothetical protein Pan44_37660 [Caulifigura coniformis]|uniref:Uncharacterized protein n=1 Tax=Caulifigura coniformis TaxID=2527983 RepID=A0A517SHX0_9PLAN|nr:hypothetical protein [Caulifigura coniformis]QDT55720.1 hypothetical protein Pan44_37660 [Caulifigura coniformis]
MGWNYRIMRHADQNGVWYGLHEAFYTDCQPEGWTKDSVIGEFESVEDLVTSLEKMLNDARRFRGDVLEYTEGPSE